MLSPSLKFLRRMAREKRIVNAHSQRAYVNCSTGRELEDTKVVYSFWSFSFREVVAEVTGEPFSSERSEVDQVKVGETESVEGRIER